MPSRSESKKHKLTQLLTGIGPVDDVVWASLKERLAPISDSYLRQLLKASGHPLAPAIEGVSTRNLDDLERTLVALESEYGHDRRVRALVIEAKDHLRWALRCKPDPLKDEMLLWVMTWLENPELFGVWVGMRKLALGRRGEREPEN